MGVADRIDFELRDYRQLDRDRRYDAIASVEMVEAVGERFWPEYFSTLDRVLATDGRIGIQAITMRARADAGDPAHVHLDAQVHLSAAA